MRCYSKSKVLSSCCLLLSTASVQGQCLALAQLMALEQADAYYLPGRLANLGFAAQRTPPPGRRPVAVGDTAFVQRYTTTTTSLRVIFRRPLRPGTEHHSIRYEFATPACADSLRTQLRAADFVALDSITYNNGRFDVILTRTANGFACAVGSRLMYRFLPPEPPLPEIIYEQREP